MSLLQNGTWIRARGKVEYDRFMQIPELAMIPNDLTEVMAPKDRMDDAAEACRVPSTYYDEHDGCANSY